MNKKKLTALLLCVICLFSCTGCYTQFGVSKIQPNNDDDNGDAGNVNVWIVVGEYEVGKDEDEYALCYSDTLELKVGRHAGEYFRTVCNAMDIDCVGVDNGYITQIGDYVNDDVNAWLFYVNGELSEVGIKDMIPTDGDDIVLSYVDWTEVFGA